MNWTYLVASQAKVGERRVCTWEGKTNACAYITLCVSARVCTFHNICEDELTKWEIVKCKLKAYNYTNYL